MRAQLRDRTMFWPVVLQPTASERANRRVKPATSRTYLRGILPFVSLINTAQVPLTNENLSYMAGQHAVSLRSTDVRAFHSGFKFFFPFLDHTRVTAELKGIEKIEPSLPTVPLTLPILVCLVMWTWTKYGLARAVGLIVGFFGLLRSAEIHKIRRSDVMFRGDGRSHVKVTTIRLGTTKNGREQVLQLAPNSLAERALRLLCESLGPHQTGPLFGFAKYSELYQLFKQFRLEKHIGINITPHSLRAGGATYLRQLGHLLPAIADAGRWEDLKTAKGYIDLLFTVLPDTVATEKFLHPTHESALAPLLFPDW